MAQALHLKPVKQNPAPPVAGAFELILEGFQPGVALTVEVWEVDENNGNQPAAPTERMLGTISGEVLQESSPSLQFLVNTTAAGTSNNGPSMRIITDQQVGNAQYSFALPLTDADAQWTITVRLQGAAALQSNPGVIRRGAQNLPSTLATYPWHGQNNVIAFYNDGSTDAAGTGGFFFDLAAAIEEARHFIFVVDWSFHPYFIFNHPTGQTIGATLVQWANSHSNSDPRQGGLVAVHTWLHNPGSPDAQNNAGNAIFFSEIPKPGNMYWRMSARSGQDGTWGFGWSNHQKFVVMDCPCPGDPNGRRTIKAFIGGLDLTQGRFDWPDHLHLPQDPGAAFHLRVTNAARTVHDWYNCEFPDPVLTPNRSSVLPDNNRANPRQPWHDIHCQFIGPSAWDLVREFVGRWSVDPVTTRPAQGDTNAACIAEVQNRFTEVLFDPSLFVQQWERHPYDGLWQAQIIRSITSDHWRTASPINTAARHPEFRWSIRNQARERSIQDMYLKMIGAAQRYIYIETQYFIGSGAQWLNGARSGVANSLPQAIADRILQRIAANQPFHVYLIIPYFPEGDPVGSPVPVNQAQRDFQWNSIAVIIRAIEAVRPNSWQRYLTVGFLANWADLPGGLRTTGTRLERVCANRRYMIYVHSKMMMVDDRMITLGSANLNERSLAGGRDSEIGVGLWPEMTKGNDCRIMLQNLRRRLFTEHFGALPPHWENPQDEECWQEILAIGRTNWALFNAGRHTLGQATKRGHFCSWPINGAINGLGLRGNNAVLIADGWEGHVNQNNWDDWFAWPTNYGAVGDLAE